MSIFRKQLKEQKEPERKNAFAEGMQALADNGFLDEKKASNDDDAFVGNTIVWSQKFPDQEIVIKGSLEEQILHLREFLNKYVFNYAILPKKGKVYNFDMDALMTIVSFVMENRNPAYDLTVSCVPRGIEVVAPAAGPESRGGDAGFEELEEAALRCVQNENGYPIVTYDCILGELAAAIFVPPYFHQPAEVSRQADYANKVLTLRHMGVSYPSPMVRAALQSREERPLKYLK